MLSNAFHEGFAAALARFKVAAITPPASAASPLAPQPAASGTAAMMPKAPSPPNAPVAADAAKASILG